MPPLTRSKPHLVRLVLVLAAGLGTSSGAFAPKAPGSFGGLVAEKSGKPISGAQVIVATPGLPPRSTFTSERGLFFIEKVEPKAGTEAVITAPGFRVRRLSLSDGEQLPLNQIVLTPGPGGPQRTVVKQSPPYQSGWGAGWSPWYELCSEPLAEREEILATRFRLEGDRRCNEWSECRESERTATRSCWKFRMQGHSERVSLGQSGAVANSRGVLEIDVRSATIVPTGPNARVLVFVIASEGLPATQTNAAVEALRNRGFGVADLVTIRSTFPSSIRVFTKADIGTGDDLARELKGSVHVSVPIELDVRSSYVRPGTVQVWLGSGASAR